MGLNAKDERERRLDVMRQVGHAWNPQPVGDDAVTEVEDLYDTDTGRPV